MDNEALIGTIIGITCGLIYLSVFIYLLKDLRDNNER